MDLEFNLFFDDGSLDLSDFIFNWDFSGPGGTESLTYNGVAPGDYLLRISNFDFGNLTGTDAEAIGSVNLGGFGFAIGNYDLHLSTQCEEIKSQNWCW